MKIESIERIEYFFVETNEKGRSSYRRPVNGDADSWEQLMGTSWEPYYNAVEIEALFQQQEKPISVEAWRIESVDRYYYASGRNYWTYVETTYWYDSHTMQRKETARKETISTGNEWNLPEWAKGITSRRKSLEFDF